MSRKIVPLVGSQPVNLACQGREKIDDVWFGLLHTTNQPKTAQDSAVLPVDEMTGLRTMLRMTLLIHQPLLTHGRLIEAKVGLL